MRINIPGGGVIDDGPLKQVGRARNVDAISENSAVMKRVGWKVGQQKKQVKQIRWSLSVTVTDELRGWLGRSCTDKVLVDKRKTWMFVNIRKTRWDLHTEKPEDGSVEAGAGSKWVNNTPRRSRWGTCSSYFWTVQNSPLGHQLGAWSRTVPKM